MTPKGGAGRGYQGVLVQVGNLFGEGYKVWPDRLLTSPEQVIKSG